LQTSLEKVDLAFIVGHTETENCDQWHEMRMTSQIPLRMRQISNSMELTYEYLNADTDRRMIIIAVCTAPQAPNSISLALTRLLENKCFEISFTEMQAMVGAQR